MANPLVYSFTLLDANGVKASTPAYYVPTAPSTITMANLVTDWAGLGDVLDDATNAQIVDGRILLPMSVTGHGWKTAPVAENDVSDVININFNNAATRYAMEFLLPNFLQAMLTNGKVDLTNVALTALINFLVSGAANGAFSNTAGQDLTALRDAFQTDRKHRRQLRNKSIATP
jgi:hypothetical protein